jgi:hypothetical protein
VRPPSPGHGFFPLNQGERLVLDIPRSEDASLLHPNSRLPMFGMSRKNLLALEFLAPLIFTILFSIVSVDCFDPVFFLAIAALFSAVNPAFLASIDS